MRHISSILFMTVSLIAASLVGTTSAQPYYGGGGAVPTSGGAAPLFDDAHYGPYGYTAEGPTRQGGLAFLGGLALGGLLVAPAAAAAARPPQVVYVVPAAPVAYYH